MSTAPLTSAGMTLGSTRWGEAPQPPQGIPHRASLEEGTVAELMTFRVNLLKHWESDGSEIEIDRQQRRRTAAAIGASRSSAVASHLRRLRYQRCRQRRGVD